MARNQSENLRPKDGVEWVIFRMATPDSDHIAALLLEWNQTRIDLLVSVRDHFYQFERIPTGAILNHIAYRDDPAVFKDHGGFNSWLIDEAYETDRDLVREFDNGEVILTRNPNTSNWDRIETDRINMTVEGERIGWEADVFGHVTYHSDNCIRLGERSIFA